ncbi:MAG: cation:proton antiporter [Lachnospiraceae bacterium]|nr:cation:proton antiporter [Lachnospiraceae bacterium]
MTMKTLADSEITYTLLALGFLMLGAYLCGRLFEKIKAPKVVGEIIGGMLFGGTFIGAVAPKFTQMIFNQYAEEGKVLNVFYQLGLIFLMFSSGYNTKFNFKKNNVKVYIALFFGATVIPMVLGIPFINIFKKYFIGEEGQNITFAMVFLIGIAITSIPVISKIFFDMNIIESKFASTVLTASTLQDLCLWILLNMAINITISDEMNIIDMLGTVMITIGMFLGIKYIGHLLKKIKVVFKNDTSFLQICFIVMLFFIALLSLLKINIMYSSFLVGYLLRCITTKDNNVNERVKCISDFAFSFFVPVYFALVGIQLNLLNHFSLVRFVLFFVIAFLLEGLGTVLTLKLFTKMDNRVIMNFGIAMNARGGPGIVLATVAYNYKIINIEYFTVLVLTTMFSSLIAGYWLRRQQIKNEGIFDIEMM